MEFEELRQSFLRKYSHLDSISWTGAQAFEWMRDEVLDPQFLKYFNLKNIQEWIEEINETIEEEEIKNILPPSEGMYSMKDILCPNELL